MYRTAHSFFQEFHPVSKFSIPTPYLWPENVSDVAYNPWTDLRRREDVEALHLKFPWEKIPSKQFFVNKSLNFDLRCINCVLWFLFQLPSHRK